MPFGLYVSLSTHITGDRTALSVTTFNNSIFNGTEEFSTISKWHSVECLLIVIALGLINLIGFCDTLPRSDVQLQKIPILVRSFKF